MDNTDQQLGSTDQHMGSTDQHMHSTDPEMNSTKGQNSCDERGDEVKTTIDTVVNIGDNSNPDILGGEAGGDVVTAFQGDVIQENNEYSEHNREFEAHVIIDQKTLTHMISEDSDLSPDPHTDASAQDDVPVDLATDFSANTERLVSVRPTERYPSSRKGAKKEKISPLKKKESMTKETLHPNSPTPMSVETCDSSMSMTSVDMCRICQCDSCEILADSPLVTPCLCAGSLKYIHQACLQKWIKSSDKMSCELCQFEYQMTKKTKPFGEWERLEMTSAERRKVICSVTFHVIAITCVIWSLYVLIDRTTEEVEAGSLLWPFWTKLIVVAIGFTGGVVFMYVQCKMYLTLCRKWRMYNKVIIIGSISEGEREKANHAGILRLCREKQLALEGGHVTNLDVFSVVHETSERVSATDVL